jgi:hypothetical protein
MRYRLRWGLVVLGASSPALAWQGLGWDWSWSPVEPRFYVDPSGFPATAGAVAEVEAALRGGMATWETEGGAKFRFDDGGVITAPPHGRDDVLVAQFAAETAAGGTFAVSESWALGDELLECDQKYFERNVYGPIDWSAAPQGAAGADVDLQYVALHEFGHCAGLDHSALRAAVMFPSTPGGLGPADRHLHADDVAGLQALYGAAPGGDLVLELGGIVVAGQSQTCTISGALPGEVVHLLAGRRGAGAGPCPAAAGGACLGIRAPFVALATEVADAAGMAQITFSVPSGLQGATLGLQAGVLRTPAALSNAEEARVLDPALRCPPGTALDCAGRCFDPAWVGDGACDDGAAQPWGNPDFDCAAYAHDGGDCGP